MVTDSSADELCIRSLVATYADAVNRYDAVLWADTWSIDGVWEVAGLTLEGREAVLDFWHKAMGGFEFALQLVYQGTVEVSGDHATGRWYLAETLRPEGADHDRSTIGCYMDHYIREDSAWRFARRTYRVLYSGEIPPGIYTPLPETS